MRCASRRAGDAPPALLVTTATALLAPLPDPLAVESAGRQLAAGTDAENFDSLVAAMIDTGYVREPEVIANKVLGRNDLTGDQRMVYVLDLTQPMGMFFARDFVIRDGDTVYVTEAPYVQWQKTLGALTGSRL